jgi:RNA polymerase sigma-70 factor (ECF subfamily)
MLSMAILRSEGVALRNAQFTALYEDVHQQAWRLALYLCGRREDAEDLLAEAVANSIRAFDRLKDSTKFRAWFLRSLRNLHIDHLRRRKRQLDVADFGGDQAVWERLGRYPTVSGPARRVELRQVFRALDRLPENLRTPLLLVGIEGYELAETAEVMGLSVSAVKVRIHRARKKLLELLGDNFEVELR